MGYRDVLDVIHRDHAAIPFTPNVVLQFHRDLLAYSSEGGGGWKIADNTIAEIDPDGTRRLRFQPLPAYRTADAVGQLHDRVNALWDERRVERLLLIAAYALDFLCIHPFADGNGRMARLLTLLLLYRDGYAAASSASSASSRRARRPTTRPCTRAPRAGMRADMTCRPGRNTCLA
jgi:Fic family protein